MINTDKSQYPTPEQIMKNPVDFRNDTLETVLKWKNEFFTGWKDHDNATRLDYLERLVYDLAKIYGISVSVDKDNNHYVFSPHNQTIHFDWQHASIISTLHEFRHAINGPDEVSACRWSIHLFKRCFPKQFEQLEFKPGSHLLVKKTA